MLQNVIWLALVAVHAEEDDPLKVWEVKTGVQAPNPIPQMMTRMSRNLGDLDVRPAQRERETAAILRFAEEAAKDLGIREKNTLAAVRTVPRAGFNFKTS